MDGPSRLLRCAGRVVDHKRRLQCGVLGSQEVDPDRLSLEGSQIEGPQHVTACPVQIGEGRKRREHRVAGIANLYLQPVEGRRRCSFGGIDLQPETQRHGIRTGWNCELLEQRVRMRRAIAVEPRIPRAGSRCLSRGVSDHTRSGGPINTA